MIYNNNNNKSLLLLDYSAQKGLKINYYNRIINGRNIIVFIAKIVSINKFPSLISVIK